jgi:hypothetical protein
MQRKRKRNAMDVEMESEIRIQTISYFIHISKTKMILKESSISGA